MKCKWRALTAGMIFVAGAAMAIEEASYTVVKKDGDFEVRDYAPQVVAETLVMGSRQDAGNKAFRRLFRYISGQNTATNKIAMTAPVGQLPATDKRTMTHSVSKDGAEQRWAVSFMMPAAYTLKTLPTPNDAAVQLRHIQARRMAAVRYSGRWTQKLFDSHHAQLADWMQARKLLATGRAEWARYNPPFSLPSLRRNEILIPVANSAQLAQ